MGPEEWNERYASVDRVWSTGPNLFVEDRLKDSKPGRGLDLAAGEGRNSIWLAGAGWAMTAVDFSGTAVERGREHGPDVEFIVGDVLEWEPSGFFDLVLIAYLHLVAEDFEKVVRRSLGWLDAGGEVFLVGHDVSNLEKGWGGPQYPEMLWDVDQIVGWLDGHRLVEASVVRRPVDSDDGQVFARDALIRARRAGSGV
jgi:SAM-dependent methyltransferase